MSKKDEQKISNIVLLSFIGGIIGFFIGASIGIGGMIFFAICGASTGVFFADQFWNKWKVYVYGVCYI